MSFDGIAEADLANEAPPPKTRGQVLLEGLLAVQERYAGLSGRLDRAMVNIDDAAPRHGAVPSSQTFPGVEEVTSFFSGARALIVLLNAEADRMDKMVEGLEKTF